MMRAAVFRQSGKPWVIETLPDPEPLVGEAVIRVGRCGICGTDLRKTSGQGDNFPCGSVLGHEFAGEVVALGKDTDRLKVSDLVTALPVAGCGHCDVCRVGMQAMCPSMTFYMGGFGEYLRIAERNAVKLPSGLSLADGALVEPLAVGLHGVAFARFVPGARVLVLGAGPIGLATIFWARQLGAGRIVAASRSARRADLTIAMGADAYIVTGEGEAERIRSALGGPPDYVFEVAGAVGLLSQAIGLVKPNGDVISLGSCKVPDPVVPGIAASKQVRLSFSRAWTLAEFEHVVDVLDRGHVEPRAMITATVGLDALPGWIDELRLPNNETKVHLDPWA
jgi:threonine dehydrogenase-like Zn-dependent dehydrogenase